jgi:hypothetical protein
VHQETRIVRNMASADRTNKRLRVKYSLEGANPRNLVARVDDGGSTTLGPLQDNINEIRCRWHRTHLFEVVDGHGYL